MTQPRLHPTAVCSDGPASLGDACAVGPFCVIAASATVGARSELQSHVVLEADVSIGTAATVGAGAVVGAGGSISDNARVGAGATIAPGCIVGTGALVRDGAAVSRSVPANAVVAGNPAQIVGYVGFDGPDPMEPVRRGSSPSEEGYTETAVRGVQLHRMPEVRDLRGSLVAGEIEGRLPFVPRRFFLVFDVPSSEVRGEHAHYECHQFLVAVEGSLHVIADDGRVRQEFVLEDEQTGLYLPPRVWGVQYRYSADCKLLVLASHPYDAEDYIRGYAEFIEEVCGRGVA